MAEQTDILLDVQGVADLLGVTRATVFRHLKNGTLPEPRRYSPRCIRWSKAEVLAYVPTPEASNA